MPKARSFKGAPRTAWEVSKKDREMREFYRYVNQCGPVKKTSIEDLTDDQRERLGL